jgi:hypothetical protein
MSFLDRLRGADLALFRRIAGWRSPRLLARHASRRTALDNVFLFLSRAANMSKLWLVIAAALARFGGRLGRRAAVRGLASLGVTSLLVNAGFKLAFERKRPPLHGLPPMRRLTHQPTSLSFP